MPRSFTQSFLKPYGSTAFLHFLFTPSLINASQPVVGESLNWNCSLQGLCCRVPSLSSGIIPQVALFLFPLSPRHKMLAPSVTRLLYSFISHIHSMARSYCMGLCNVPYLAGEPFYTSTITSCIQFSFLLLV